MVLFSQKQFSCGKSVAGGAVHISDMRRGSHHSQNANLQHELVSLMVKNFGDPRKEEIRSRSRIRLADTLAWFAPNNGAPSVVIVSFLLCVSYCQKVSPISSHHLISRCELLASGVMVKLSDISSICAIVFSPRYHCWLC